MRAFVAIELPARWKDRLQGVQRDLENRVPDHSIRWVRREAFHLTLKFLGELEPAVVDLLSINLREPIAALASPVFAIEDVGCFPNPNRPQVIWAGLRGDLVLLGQIQESIDRVCREAGARGSKRPFQPHLTLGRVRRQTNRSQSRMLAAEIKEYELGQFETWQADEITLMQSDLQPSGAVYTPFGKFSLGPGELS